MDWMKVGWGPTLDPTFDKGKNLYIDVGNAQFTDRLPLDVAVDVVHQITKTHPGPFTLMVSGGVDSQSMWWAWHKAGVEYKAVFVQYMMNGVIMNDHDRESLQQFSNTNSLDVEYLSLDIIDFLENNLTDYAHKYQCTSPQICTYMRMSELITEGTIIFSGNFLLDVGVPFDYTIYGIKRYADISGRSIIPFFFLHDAELAPSFIKTINRVKTSEEYAHRAGLYDEKILAFTLSGFPVIPQPKKYSGFEKIKDHYDKEKSRVTFRERLKYANKPSKRIFDILFRYRLTKHIDYVDPVIMINLKENKHELPN